MEHLSARSTGMILPGQALAMQDLGWSILLCTTEGPYALQNGEIKPLGLPPQNAPEGGARPMQSGTGPTSGNS